MKKLPVIVCVVIAFCSVAGWNKSNVTKVSIRLKWLHQAQFAGFYYADKMGYYKKDGVDVVLKPAGDGLNPILMVANGTDQFGVVGADQILIAREKGIPVVALAVIYRKSPFILFSLKKSGITNIHQFVGKKVGVKFGGNEELTYRAMLANDKVDWGRIEEYPAKFDITPLLSGRVDVWPGYAINEPIFLEEKGFAVNYIYPSEYGINLYADTLFTTESMIKNKPTIVRKITRSTIRGWEEALKNPEKAVDYTLQYDAKLIKKHEAKMMSTSIQFIKPDNKPVGFMNEEEWISMQQLLISQGFMKKQIDISKAHTTEFLPDTGGNNER